MIFGVLLAVLGVVLYAMADPELKKEWKALTAFIPTGFGAALIVIGQIAQSGSEKVRMHSMHAAALIGLVGVIGGVVMTILDIRKLGGDTPPSNLAMGGKAALAVLCAAFLALCIKSFIEVRRARKQKKSRRFGNSFRC